MLTATPYVKKYDATGKLLNPPPYEHGFHLSRGRRRGTGGVSSHKIGKGGELARQLIKANRRKAA